MLVKLAKSQGSDLRLAMHWWHNIWWGLWYLVFWGTGMWGTFLFGGILGSQAWCGNVNCGFEMSIFGWALQEVCSKCMQMLYTSQFGWVLKQKQTRKTCIKLFVTYTLQNHSTKPAPEPQVTFYWGMFGSWVQASWHRLAKCSWWRSFAPHGSLGAWEGVGRKSAEHGGWKMRWGWW